LDYILVGKAPFGPHSVFLGITAEAAATARLWRIVDLSFFWDAKAATKHIWLLSTPCWSEEHDRRLLGSSVLFCGSRKTFRSMPLLTLLLLCCLA
jgi:hypothetical protein